MSQFSDFFLVQASASVEMKSGFSTLQGTILAMAAVILLHTQNHTVSLLFFDRLYQIPASTTSSRQRYERKTERQVIFRSTEEFETRKCSCRVRIGANPEVRGWSSLRHNYGRPNAMGPSEITDRDIIMLLDIILKPLPLVAGQQPVNCQCKY